MKHDVSVDKGLKCLVNYRKTPIQLSLVSPVDSQHLYSGERSVQRMF